jgi:hypothetical protein
MLCKSCHLRSKMAHPYDCMVYILELEIFFLESTMPRAKIFCIKHHHVMHYKFLYKVFPCCHGKGTGNNLEKKNSTFLEISER